MFRHLNGKEPNQKKSSLNWIWQDDGEEDTAAVDTISKPEQASESSVSDGDDD